MTTHAKLLAKAARIVGMETDDPIDGSYFESRCLDWLAKRCLRVSVTVRDGMNTVDVVEVDALFRHKLRHVALASAVCAVAKQESAK